MRFPLDPTQTIAHSVHSVQLKLDSRREGKTKSIASVVSVVKSVTAAKVNVKLVKAAASC